MRKGHELSDPGHIEQESSSYQTFLSKHFIIKIRRALAETQNRKTPESHLCMTHFTLPVETYSRRISSSSEAKASQLL